MGGQACVFYGAAEFSRDCDIVLLTSAENIARLSKAAADLQAKCIAVPPFEQDYLDRGHAIHFRCEHPDAAGIRLDVMSRMRNVAPFEDLWGRRTTIEDETGLRIELIGLEDLIHAKKTQRDKDWPMIRRLVEAHHAQHHAAPTDAPIRFWLCESRTPELLVELAAKYSEHAEQLTAERPLMIAAINGDPDAIAQGLADEQSREVEQDRRYWTPLKAELEQLRAARRR